MNATATLFARLSTISKHRLADALQAHHQQRLRSRTLRSDSTFVTPPQPPVLAPPARHLYQALRRGASWFDLLAKLYGQAVQLALRPSPAMDVAAEDAADSSAAVDIEVVKVLKRLELLLLTYPAAAQAAFSALVAEGQAFALTAEGARYDRELRASRALAKPWLILEKLSSRLLIEHKGLVLPSGYVDALLQGAKLNDLGPLMGRLFGGG